MSVQEVTMYRIRCDRCAACAQDKGDFYAWADAEQAWDDAANGDWNEIDDKHYCPDCVEWTEDEDALRPKAETVA